MNPLSNYGTDAWVDALLEQELSYMEYERIASELGKEGYMRALIRLHLGLCKKKQTT